MTFGGILGQAAALALLHRARASGRIPHALLFQGPSGVGKADAARAFAAAIVCERRQEDACGACGACLKAAHGNHPDFLWVTRLPRKESARDEQIDETGVGEEPGRGELRKDILVSQIRDLSEHAHFAPREAARRIFVIDPAERMNPAAQNALLKTLEEPPGASILVLVTSRPHLLLSTVRSRCTAVRFAAMRVPDLARALEARGMPRDEALARAALSGGRPRLAIDLDLNTARAQREEVLSILECMAPPRPDLACLGSMAAQLTGDDEQSLHAGLDLAEGLLRDATRAAVGLEPETLIHADLFPRLSTLGASLGAERGAEMIRGIERLRDELRFNLNKTLLAESLLAAVAGGPQPA